MGGTIAPLPSLQSIPSASGPRVARFFGIGFGAVCLWAFVDLWIQAPELILAGGLEPIADLMKRLAEADASVLDAPSLFWISSSDGFIHAVLGAGVLASVALIAGLFPRIAALAIAVLYLSLQSTSGAFLAFQWDVLLIECAVLAALLPRDRAAPIAHWLLRLLLFKLYFESGIAKMTSPLGDWFDGSAMSFYYETAPLPGPLAWYAHHLPDGWHAFESWLVLALEVGGALLIFGPRKARWVALVGFTGFQLVNLATANYGFFVYLALVLHVFLLDEADIERLGKRIPSESAGGSLAGARCDRRSSRPARRGFAGAYWPASPRCGWCCRWPRGSRTSRARSCRRRSATATAGPGPLTPTSCSPRSPASGSR